MLFLCRYDDSEVALNCGIMLRECMKYETLARIVLFDDRFYKCFEYVEMSTFDIASDAFTTFKVKWHLITVAYKEHVAPQTYSNWVSKVAWFVIKQLKFSRPWCKLLHKKFSTGITVLGLKSLFYAFLKAHTIQLCTHKLFCSSAPCKY